MRNAEEVQEFVEEFTKGNPVHREVEVGDGALLLFDNSYQEDLEERHIVAVLQVEKSEYPSLNPEETPLYDYTELEEIDVHLQRIFGEYFSDVYGPEYNDTDKNCHNYYYSLYQY